MENEVINIESDLQLYKTETGQLVVINNDAEIQDAKLSNSKFIQEFEYFSKNGRDYLPIDNPDLDWYELYKKIDNEKYRKIIRENILHMFIDIDDEAFKGQYLDTISKLYTGRKRFVNMMAKTGVIFGGEIHDENDVQTLIITTNKNHHFDNYTNDELLKWAEKRLMPFYTITNVKIENGELKYDSDGYICKFTNDFYKDVVEEMHLTEVDYKLNIKLD